jgi:hypothetical protein
MKKLLVLIGFLISTSLNGQFLDNYGIRTGLNSSNQYWDIKGPGGRNTWRYERTGFQVYFTGDKAITRYISFRPEVGYIQKGFVNDLMIHDSNGSLYSKSRDDVLCHNLSSNLAFKLKFFKSKLTPYLSAGVQLNYLIGYEDVIFDIHGTDISFYEHVINDFNKLTIAGLLGVGFEYNQTFFIDLEYNPAITNNINDEEHLVFDRSFALTLGLNISKFIVSKKQKSKNKKYRSLFFCPKSRNYSCDLTNWKCTGGGIETYSRIISFNSISQLVEGTKAAYFGNYLSNTCSSAPHDTLCLRNSDCSIVGIPSGYPLSGIYYGDVNGVSLEQSVSNLIKGNTYILEFWAGGESGSSAFPNSGIFAVDIGFGRIYLKNKPTKRIEGIGTRYLIQFKATSDSHTIKFTNWGHICETCTELVLDDVRLYTLEELSPSVTPCITKAKDIDKKDKISFYPNPFSNELQIKSSGVEQMDLILYDFTSALVLEEEFTNSISIITKHLPTGFYFYVVKSKNGIIQIGKLLKN